MDRYKTDLMWAFKRAAAKPEGPTGSDFFEAVLRERPDLKGQMAYFPTQGGCGYTIFIGDEVFKGPQGWALNFPGYKDPGKKFDKEHEVLEQLGKHGLPVPKLTCVGKETYFYGMTRVRGVALSQVVHKMTAEEKCTLSEEIVDFLINMAKAMPAQDGKYAVHRDLHANNILVDPVTKKLTAVIDFGSVKYSTKKDLEYYPVSSLGPYMRRAFKARKDELPDLPPAVPQQKQQLPKHLDVLKRFTRMCFQKT